MIAPSPTARSLAALVGACIACCALATGSSVRRPAPDPGATPFPDSSLYDFSVLLDPPAGKHGFLSINSKGQFAWPGGKRARFWGLNISNRSVFVDRPTIDRVVPVLARAGVNMVRFEAIDSSGGLLHDAAGRPVRSPDPSKLDTLDYWTAALRARGIYYYFDLLDLRTFQAADGVPDAAELGRAARPYAMFDRQLIALQKAYARELLLHRNPYTGLAYTEDPALAMVEICNESGFFLRPEVLRQMPDRLAASLRSRWNGWLVERYRTRQRLEAAWKGASGAGRAQFGLAAGEDPAAQTVRLPTIVAKGGSGSAPPNTARYRDGIRFLASVQADYFREMKGHLRGLGLKAPVTGVASTQHLADAAAGMPLDFTAGNYYCDHPAFAREEWKGSLFFSDTNPLRESGIYRSGPWLAALRWGSRPAVIREWAQPWPNRFRAVATAEMAAYGSLQDMDGLLLFGYQIAPRPEKLGDFYHQSDPTVWGLFGPGALSFLRGDIKPAGLTVHIAHEATDVYGVPGTLGDGLRLAWHVKVSNYVREAGRPPAGRPAYPAKSRAADVLRDLSRRKLIGAAPKGAELASSTGQIVRRTSLGAMTVNTSRTVIVSGEIANRLWSVGPVRLRTASRIGTFWIVSVDGRPLSASRRYLAKMVTIAHNTGEAIVRAQPGAPARYRLDRSGDPPVRTMGRRSPSGVQLTVGARPTLSLDLADGTWELLVEEGRATLWCDTPGISGRVLGHRIQTPRKGLVILER